MVTTCLAEAAACLYPSPLEAAAARVWDVVIVGAGPAGALAAYELAQQGCAVLLIDKATFPRWKVCGGCLNGRALATLAAAGLGELPSRHGAVPLHRLLLGARGSQATVRLTQSMAFSRQTFDAALVRAARAVGAVFLPQTLATWTTSSQQQRLLHLRSGGRQVDVSAAVLLAADGLGGRLLAEEVGNSERQDPKGGLPSRLGAGVIADAAPEFYAPGTIYMAYSPGGYVGLVRIEDGRLDLGAAFDPAWVKSAGGLGQAAVGTLDEAGFPPLPGLADLSWRGTPLLTRRTPRLAAERAFVLGDAAGYIEPFTGEGIAWALAAARAVAPLALRAVKRWTPALAEEWAVHFRRTVARRQLPCQFLTWILRHPTSFRGLFTLLARWPNLAAPVVRLLNRP